MRQGSKCTEAPVGAQTRRLGGGWGGPTGNRRP